MAAAASGENVAPARAPTPVQPFPVPAPVLPSGGAGGSLAPAPAASREIIGEGAYGAVLKPALPNYYNGAWHEYPDNVTKLFFQEKSKRNILALKPRIESILGSNRGHRINEYRFPYKVKNTPANLRAMLLRTKGPNNNLFPVRMPYLGIDLSRSNLGLHYKKIRERPVSVILAQTLKLLQQVKNINDNDYIHGDIRAVNVMINPNTGEMTLIDFDFMNKLDVFYEIYPFGFYCHPPETLFFFLKKSGRSKLEATMQEYIHWFLREFDHFSPLLGYNQTVDGLRTYLVHTIHGNVHSDSTTEESMLRTFDSYSLAWTLLSLYTYLYTSHSIRDASNLTDGIRASFKSGLSSRVPAGTNLDAASKAILSMTSMVLVPLSKMEFSRRIGIDEAFARASAIVAEYEATIAGAAVGGGEGAVGGGSVAASSGGEGAVGGGSVAASSGGGGGASNTRRSRTRRRRGSTRRVSRKRQLH